MKRKKVQNALIAAGSLLLCAVIVVAAGNLIYYDRYKKSTASFDITESATDKRITVMSANVRTWSPLDIGKRSWFYRADLQIANIASVKPDIIGFQEVTAMHYNFLTNALKGYDNVIQYRTDGKFAEACPVFYRSDRFTLKDKGSFWLSETPEVMSKDWGSACYRICSYAVLTDKASGKDFVVFNTHLDHISDEARINGIHVVLDKIKQFGNLPSIIMGDFNADEASDTYKAATALFDDAKYRADDTEKGATYQCWGSHLDDENIDYFMISKTKIKVDTYQIIDNTYDGVYPSDHFAIALGIRLE